MFRLLSIGILSGFFFSTTFVLNRLMSIEGGHWVWTAGLRYFFMLLFLFSWFFISGNISLLRTLLILFRNHWQFWVFTGTIGFGFFYALISYSAVYSPAWVIATTWQTTIVATPIVLFGFRKNVPRTALLFSLLIFAGVILANLSQVENLSLREILLGGIPVLIAAFCYPIGNQMVWEVQNSQHARLPKIKNTALDHPFAKVFLMSMGSVPFWLLLTGINQPPLPSSSQVTQTAMVALFSGIIATSLFLYARQSATTPYELSAVDATQSSEVVFALIAEIIFLQAALPNLQGFIGIGVTLIGLCLYLFVQKK